MSERLPSDSQVSHYRILAKIGEGGMGEVYLAQDSKLDRKVALKILPRQLAGNEDRMRRFTQEAKAAAALNHPNIATIHEVGESEGVNFIAMEFIDGVTLRQKIANLDRKREVPLRRIEIFIDRKPQKLRRLRRSFYSLDNSYKHRTPLE